MRTARRHNPAPLGGFVFKALPLLTGAAVLLIALSARSESINDVLNSTAVQELSKQSAAGRIDTSHYSAALPKKKGYAQLFVDPAGPALISRWLGADTPRTALKTTGTKRTEDFIQVDLASRVNKQTVTVQVLVPSPNSRDLVRFGAIKEFSQQEPPVLKPSRSSLVKFKGFQGALYQTGASCTVLVKLEQNALLSARSSCEIEKGLIKFVEHLPVSRLNKKLRL